MEIVSKWRGMAMRKHPSSSATGGDKNWHLTQGKEVVDESESRQLGRSRLESALAPSKGGSDSNMLLKLEPSPEVYILDSLTNIFRKCHSLKHL